MKKIILPIIILSLLFGTGVLAQKVEFSSPGLTPDSPFYFLDILGEKIEMFFTFGAEKKFEKALKFAEEKLAEVKVMAEKNKTNAMEKASKKYQDYLGLANQKVQEAKERGKDVEKLVSLIAEKSLKHQEILLEVYEKVSEQAKEGIEKAIEMFKKGYERAIEAVSGAKKKELQQKAEEVRVKINIEKAFLICQKIDDREERELCGYTVRGKGEKCQDEDCFQLLAIRNQDPELCKDLSGSHDRLLCEALANRDSAWCERAETEGIRYFCYSYVALMTEDLKGCEGSASPNLCKAIITKNPTLCKQASSDYREDCYYKVGAIKGDPDLCEYVKDLGKRKACQKIAKRDISGLTCKREENKVCSFIAALKENPSICEKTSLQGECYSMIAFLKIGFMPKYFLIAIEDWLPSLK